MVSDDEIIAQTIWFAYSISFLLGIAAAPAERMKKMESDCDFCVNDPSSKLPLIWVLNANLCLEWQSPEWLMSWVVDVASVWSNSLNRERVPAKEASSLLKKQRRLNREVWDSLMSIG